MLLALLSFHMPHMSFQSFLSLFLPKGHIKFTTSAATPDAKINSRAIPLSLKNSRNLKLHRRSHSLPFITALSQLNPFYPCEGSRRRARSDVGKGWTKKRTDKTRKEFSYISVVQFVPTSAGEAARTYQPEVHMYETVAGGATIATNTRSRLATRAVVIAT